MVTHFSSLVLLLHPNVFAATSSPVSLALLVQPPKSGKSALGTKLFLLAAQGLFTWRWGTPRRWFNSFRWGKYPPIHNLYFKFDCVYMIGEVTRQGGPAARSCGRAVFIMNSNIYLSESCLLDYQKVAKKNQPNIQKVAKFQKLLPNIYFLIFSNVN